MATTDSFMAAVHGSVKLGPGDHISKKIQGFVAQEDTEITAVYDSAGVDRTALYFLGAGGNTLKACGVPIRVLPEHKYFSRIVVNTGSVIAVNSKP